MVIGVTGYGYTGASACMDLLKEFENVQYYNPHMEFQILQQPDGIADLRYNLVQSRRRINVNAAIIRFIRQYKNRRNDRLSSRTDGKYISISKEYIDTIISVSWKGKSSYDPSDLLNIFEDYRFRYFNAIIKRSIFLVNPNFIWPPCKTRYYSCISEQQFIEKTKNYLNKIFDASGFDIDKPIILEQLFSLENPTDGSDYFKNFRSIIVDRDPRDIYVLTNRLLSKQASAFMPNNGNVESFVKYYKGLHHSISNSEYVFYLQYEDLIYRYDETVRKLEEFLGIKHVFLKSFFKPEWSINNTCMYKQCPELNADIEYIEMNLSEYLYPFENYKNNLSIFPENVGIFDVIPGDKKFNMNIKNNKFGWIKY